MSVVYDQGLQRMAEAKNHSDVLRTADGSITEQGGVVSPGGEGEATGPAAAVELGIELAKLSTAYSRHRPIHGVLLDDGESVQVAFFVGSIEQVQRRIDSLPAAGDDE